MRDKPASTDRTHNEPVATRMHDEPNMPDGRSRAIVTTRRRLVRLALGVAMIATLGCAGPAIRSQSPEIEALAAVPGRRRARQSGSRMGSCSTPISRWK